MSINFARDPWWLECASTVQRILGLDLMGAMDVVEAHMMEVMDMKSAKAAGRRIAELEGAM